jgi:hypothetical protein
MFRVQRSGFRVRLGHPLKVERWKLDVECSMFALSFAVPQTPTPNLALRVLRVSVVRRFLLSQFLLL